MSSQLRAKLEKQLNKAWYGQESSALSAALKPLSVLYKSGLKLSQPRKEDVYQSPIPVVVVGNIVAGGAGKTPLVIALCEHLADAGYRPGILSRGYRAGVERFPHMVAERDDAEKVGDEPKLMHNRLNVPVCIDPERSRGARYLFAHQLCDVIVLDDGLQHRKLARDIEIAVVDGRRLLGNGLCLPAGPLREPSSRLDSVDFVVMNGRPDSDALHDSGISKYDAVMSLRVDGLVNLISDEVISIEAFLSKDLRRTPIAMCGIGNPERFYQTLKDEGITHVPRTFADHHAFAASDLAAAPDQALIMTEKDAVKCRPLLAELGGKELVHKEIWFLRVSATLPDTFYLKFKAEFDRTVQCQR